MGVVGEEAEVEDDVKPLWPVEAVDGGGCCCRLEDGVLSGMFWSFVVH